MRSVTTTLLLVTLTFSALAQDVDNPETLTERSQASARAVLDRAVDAMGGAAALRSMATIRFRTEGRTWRRLQSPTVSPPFEAGEAPGSSAGSEKLVARIKQTIPASPSVTS